MAGKSFSFKNTVLGVLLGVSVVAGWAFFPQIESAVRTRTAVKTAALSETTPADAGEPDGAPSTAGGLPDETAPAPNPAPHPVEPAVVEPVAHNPAKQAFAPDFQSDDVPVAADPLEASPGWNPEVAKALLEPIDALQVDAAEGSNPPVAAMEVSQPLTPGIDAAPQPVVPETATSHPPAPPEPAEEARWQALLASPFFPERAESYPFGACFKEAAAQNRLPLPVVLGLAAYQSNFDPEVVSDSGFGILNVGWPRPAKNLGIARKEVLIEDPCANISAGSKYLAALLRESHGQWVPALASYRRRVEPAYLGRIRAEDLQFSQELRRHVEEVTQQPFQPKTMYPFWEFDEQITAKRFMKMVQQQSGVHLWLRQQGFGYVIYIPATDPAEKRRKLQLIEQETGLQTILAHREDTPS